MRVKITTSTEADATEIISKGLRLMSVRESEFILPNAVDTLRGAIGRGAYCWTGRLDGEIICMWGVERPTLISREGYLWFLTTSRIEDHSFIVARKSQLFIDEILERKEFDRIVGLVDAKFDRSVKWLRWLGFIVGATDHSTGMRPFEMRII